MPNFWDALESGAVAEVPSGAVRKRLKISLLDEGEKQYRETLDPENVDRLKELIKSDGFNGVVWVYPKEDGRYGIISGHTSTTSARQAGETEIDCAIYEGLSRRRLAALSYLGNSSHRALNPIEDTIGILDNLREAWIEAGGSPDDDIKTLLGRTEALMRGRAESAEMSPEFVQAIFNELGVSVGIRSFIRDRLPLLNLHPDVAEAVKFRGLAPTAAIAINRTTDEAMRAELLEQAVEGEISVAAIKGKVKEGKTGPAAPQQPLVLRYREVGAKLAKVKELPPDKAGRVSDLLSELDALIS